MDCIIFEGSLRNGYGQLGTPKWGTKVASRAVLAESLGRKLERHEFACHTCDVKACVNPEHLYLGDHATNMQDRAVRGSGMGCVGYKFPQATKDKISSANKGRKMRPEDVVRGWAVRRANAEKRKCGQ